jgi:glycosyltransferase involved in cell wall biosynthesis
MTGVERNMSISVIMTCHNEAAFIEQAIRSVVAQTAHDLIGEIIVVNDGSTDDSQVMLERLASEIPKLSIILSSSVGLPAARNLALAKAGGNYIALLDGDDYWAIEKTRKQMEAFVASPDIGLVYSDFHDFSASDAADAQLINVRAFQATDSGVLATYFVHDAPIVPSTAIIRREVFNSVGVFDAAIKLGEDTEMFLRIAERWRFQHVRGGLTYKRRHGKSLTHRLDRLVPVAEMLTQRFVERNPELAPLAGKRMARRYASAGNSCATLGEKRKAFSYFLSALRLDPSYGRLYVYFLMALVPGSLGFSFRRHSRALYHGIVRDGMLR